MTVTDRLTPAARDILLTMLYRDQDSVLVEPHNRDAVTELQAMHFLSRNDGGDGPGREGWFSITPSGEQAIASFGVPRGMQKADANLGQVSTAQLKIAAEYFDARISSRPGGNSFRSALGRVLAQLNTR